MTNPHLALVAPAPVNGTVSGRPRPPRRKRNAESRAREYLTDGEIARLISAAGENRHGHRDATMVLVAYRHGLRAGELVTLRWDAIDFAHGRLHVSRLKGSAESVHPLSGRELRALRRLKREQDLPSPFVFTSERGSPITPAGFRKMVARLGVAADFASVHPHMLRHACGFKLANDGRRYSLAAGLPRPQEHPAHRALHRTVADPVQEFLARLIGLGRFKLVTSISSAMPVHQGTAGSNSGGVGLVIASG